MMFYWNWMFVILVLMNQEAVSEKNCTGKPQDLVIPNKWARSAYFTWGINRREDCVDIFKLVVCHNQRCSEDELTPDHSFFTYSSYIHKTVEKLEPCTDYHATVEAVNLHGNPSSESISKSFTTGYEAPGVVGDIRVTKVTPNSLTVMWSEPTSAPRCTEGYNLVLRWQGEFKQQIYQKTVGINTTSLTFTELVPCTRYYISVNALPNNNSRRDSVTANPLEVKSTSEFTSGIGVVGDIRVTKVTPNSLTVMWSEPTSAPRCTKGYNLVLRWQGEFKQQIYQKTVGINTTSLTFTELDPCTLYYISVTALPNTNSRRDPVTANLLEDKSTFSYTSGIEFKVNVISGTYHCNISYWYTPLEINELEPCTTYNIYVTVLFWRGLCITAHTLPGDNMTVSNLTLGRVSLYSLHLKWFLSAESSACVSGYLVTFIRIYNKTLRFETTAKNYTLSNENICGLESVSVQILSKGKLWGVPAIIDIRRRYEDVTLLSFKVNKTANRSVEVLLTSVSFICVTHYDISWHSPSSPNITSPLTMFNRSVSSDLLPCTEYKAVVQPWNGRFKLQAINLIVATEQEECPTSAVPIIVGLIVLAVVITSVLSFIGWRKWREEERYTTIKRTSSLKKNKTSELFEGLTLEQFLQHSENVLSSPDQLKAEFDILESENHEYPHVIGILDHNKPKNRYYNIIPYDLTRVILEGDYENDYINASHVKLQEARSVNYLACQSPKAGTCGDFWKMIFQFRVKIVVMISMPDEIDKKKGFMYYPRPKEVVMHDNIVISCRKEEDFSNYIVRSLVADKAGVVLDIKQFHFVGWPEFGVPESPDVMVRFVDAVQNVSKGKKHYMAVHCSAGAGRTGTFIALDALMRLIRQKWNCKFNILDIVHKMRQQRCKMVRTVVQYKYIYECMKYALENHRSTFVKVRMNLYKRSKNERRLEGSDSKDVIHLEDLSRPQTSVVT